MDNGYIKITRQILYSEIMGKPAEWFKIWMVIIMKCNYEDNGIYKRGELVTKYENIAAECGVSRNTVKSFIEWARGATLVTPQQLKRGVRIVVNNYDKYQGWATPSTPPTMLPSTPAINNRIQKDKKTKTGSGDFDSFWSVYPKRVEKKAAMIAYKKVSSEHTEIMKGLAKYNQHWKKENTEKRYIPGPAVFLNGRRWEDELDIAIENKQSYNPL